MTGETNFQQDMAFLKDKAEQQGAAQPEMKSAVADIKKVSLPLLRRRLRY